ncbi:MAG TPA: penicillin acylase family protein [Actinomycetota bacterium]|nr:penicillin acylase family protein [Actinomycetota bacterium]
MSDPMRAMAEASLFPLNGELDAQGLTDAVTVERDAYGVPRITADSLDDLWFAQGFVTAGERLFQLELALRLATGRLSEIFSEPTYDDDVFMRTIGLNRAGTKHVRDWNETDRAMHGQFRAGVHAWIDRMPVKPIEYQLLDLDPDIPDEPAPYAAAIALLAWNLSSNWDAELLRAELDERIHHATTDLLLPSSSRGGVGSNNWAVAGARTASGKPLLAGDPHLLVTQPGAWFELHLRAPGYDVRGVALPFLPGIILGATPHHAWTATNVTGDAQDLFEEQLNDDGTAARSRDGWEPLTIHDEPIVVRGESEPRVLEVRESRHGPILTHGIGGVSQAVYRPIERTFALRWTGHDATLRPSLTLEAARATDADAFGAAVLQIGCPGQNFVYADVDGTIAYQCTGRFPIRANGNGTRPVPGWDGEHEWIGWIPAEELPHETNPERGWLATANNDIQPADLAYLIGADFHRPARRDRIVELVTERDHHDVSSMRAMQTDTVSLAVGGVLPALLKLHPGGDDQREVLDRLATWNGDIAAGSHEAAVYELWLSAIMRRFVGERIGDTLFTAYTGFREIFVGETLPAMLAHSTDRVDPAALRDALGEAIELAGGRTWGEIHTLTLAHPLARIPGLGDLFTAAAIPHGGDESTICQGAMDPLRGHVPSVIPSWRAVWDLGDLERSVAVVPSGVSGNPASPHWADQSPLYAAGDARPAGFRTPAAATLTLRPAQVPSTRDA